MQLIKDIDAQIDRALSLLRDGERTPYFLKGDGVFSGGQTTPLEIALGVPADGDFYATSFSLLVDARAVPDDGDPKVPFLPVDWTYTNDVYSLGALESTDLGQVSGMFELLLPEKYANSPTWTSSTFSARHGYRANDGHSSFSAFAGKLWFLEDVFIPRKTTVTVRFTPTYSFAGDGAVEYRVTAVLEGNKRVKAFR